MSSNEIVLSKTLYEIGKIDRAVRDFSKIVKIKIEERRDDYVCHLSSFVTNKDRTILEFENYLISLMNQSEEYMC